METQGRTEAKKMRAVEALKSVLTHVSGVKLRTVESVLPAADARLDIIAQVEVYGHSHTLACMLVPNDEPQLLRETVMGFSDRAGKVAKNATPVLIASHVSGQLQSLCREIHAGMIDLNGNACIELGEIFIRCRQMTLPGTSRKLPRTHAIDCEAHSHAAA